MSHDGVQYVPKPCALCQGTGNYGKKGFFKKEVIICTICNGKGSVLVASPPMTCGLCKGKGWFYDGREREHNMTQCHSCGGSGWAHAR